MENKEQDSKKKLKEPKYVLSEKKWYKNAWMWVSFVFILLTIFLFIGYMGMGNEDEQKSQINDLQNQVSSLKDENKKLIEQYSGKNSSGTTSTSNTSSSSKEDSASSKKSGIFKFGQTQRFKVGENSIVQITVNSAQKVNSDDPTVEYMEEKGFAEYVALSYTVKCEKGEVDTYSVGSYNISVTGADGVIAKGTGINIGANEPSTLKEGQTFEFKYGYGLKKISPTLQVSFSDGKWVGDITQ